MMRRSSLKRIGKPVRMKVVTAPTPIPKFPKHSIYASGKTLDTYAIHATGAIGEAPGTTEWCHVCNTAQLLIAQGFLTLSMEKYVPTLHNPKTIVHVNKDGVLDMVEP